MPHGYVKDDPFFCQAFAPEELSNGKQIGHDLSFFANDSEISFDDLDVQSRDLELSDHKEGLSGIAVINEDELICEACGKTVIACFRFPTGEPEMILFVTGEEKASCGKVRVLLNDLIIILAGDNLKITKERVRMMVKRKELKKMSPNKITKEIIKSINEEGIVIAARIKEMV